jgi:hypothetical protein
MVTLRAICCIHLEGRRVDIVDLTTHPNEPWVLKNST